MLTLVLGGARSGKSEVAERLAGEGPVTYVATAMVGDDADMAERVERHRQRRPQTWSTVEVVAPGTLASVLVDTLGTVLLDSLTTWVAMASNFEVDTEDLCTALAKRAGDTVVVSDEVGMGVSPSTAAGNRFRDVLGLVNQEVAAAADEVVLVVAGRTLRLS